MHSVITNFRSTERFSYDLEKWFRYVFVICFISQWMKRSKHALFVFPPKKTLMWRRHCSIGQSCFSMTPKWSIDWFLKSSRDKKMHFIWVSRYLARKYYLRTLFLRPQLETGRHFTWSSGQATRKSRRLPQCKGNTFSIILRPWVLVPPRESNPRPSALQSSALPTELILPRERFFHPSVRLTNQKPRSFASVG